jgi:multidrug resistance efflux pump
MKNRRFLLLLLLLIPIGGGVYYFLDRKPASIVLTGIVSTDEVRVSAMLQGLIDELRVNSGDRVEKGQLLARIQPSESAADLEFYRQTEKASAASVDEAAAQLKYLETQTREQIRQAQADLASAQAQARQADADLENARLSFERAQRLREQSINSQQDLDQARTTYESARAHVDSANEQVRSAEAALALSQANAEQIEVRKAALQASNQQLAAAGAQTEGAKIRLGYTEVRAPIDGIVDVRAALAGEVVMPGQTIVTLIDPDDLWIRADVEETYVDAIHLGDTMQVRLPSGALRECSVFYRGVDADYATQRDVSRTKRDIRTFQIRLRCDNTDRSLALGMTAYVTLPLQ